MLTFKVVENSEFYSKYFLAKKEEEKFKIIASEFFKNHDIDGAKMRFSLSKYLRLDLNKDDKEKFASQIKKKLGEDGLCNFKQNSPMQKLWTKAVVGQIDFPTLEGVRLWYMGHFNYKVSYNLWDYNGSIYGVLDGLEVTLPNDTIEIKNSEYYMVIEEIEEEVKEKQNENNKS